MSDFTSNTPKKSAVPLLIFAAMGIIIIGIIAFVIRRNMLLKKKDNGGDVTVTTQSCTKTSDCQNLIAGRNGYTAECVNKKCNVTSPINKSPN